MVPSPSSSSSPMLAKRALVAALVLAVVAVGFMLVRGLSDESTAEVDQPDNAEVKQPMPGVSPGGNPSPVMRATPQAANRPTRPTPPIQPAVDPAAPDGATASDSTASQPALPRARAAKERARVKQRDIYRDHLRSLAKQRERLMATLRRLEQEGAGAAAIESVQRRIQQLNDAEPRMRKHLRSLESPEPKQE